MSTASNAIFVCGPTASGKSTHAVRLAAGIDGEIVNADAFQLYRGVEILTAAPGLEERREVPHHLFGVLDPAAPNDAFQFHQLAAPVLADITARGRTPVVVGGSGLYLKFLSHGPSGLPAADPDLRAELAAQPLDDLVAELRILDPDEAATINLANRRYVSRALEICRLSGQPASRLRHHWKQTSALIESSLHGVVIRRPRADLHQRIARRTSAMLDHGAIDEVENIAAPAPNLARAIGFGEIRDLLAGTIDRPTCEERINTATRRYSKRQETWFRRERWLKQVVPE